jgi:hypothetical protein
MMLAGIIAEDRDIVADASYGKWRFANARPEPVFR